MSGKAAGSRPKSRGMLVEEIGDELMLESESEVITVTQTVVRMKPMIAKR